MGKGKDVPFGKIRHGKKRAFLVAYAELGNISEAAKAARCNRQSHLNWLKRDGLYALAFKDAQEQAIDRLEKEAQRRAHDGVVEPVYYQGKVVGGIKRYSDTLLIFLLKGLRPDKYRERYDMRHSGADGADIGLRIVIDDGTTVAPDAGPSSP